LDWENSVPHIVELLSSHIPGLRIQKDVTDILKDGGLNLNDVKAFILSHWHFDHCNSMQREVSSSPATDVSQAAILPNFRNRLI
jgi:glyoxylase-like metal-dependent hydrolase (beta-lactamase superfamily II)